MSSYVYHSLSSFKCAGNYHAPTDCETIKRWLTKCADDSETANYISAHTKDVSFNLFCKCLLKISKAHEIRIWYLFAKKFVISVLHNCNGCCVNKISRIFCYFFVSKSLVQNDFFWTKSNFRLMYRNFMIAFKVATLTFSLIFEIRDCKNTWRLYFKSFQVFLPISRYSFRIVLITFYQSTSN